MHLLVLFDFNFQCIAPSASTFLLIDKGKMLLGFLILAGHKVIGLMRLTLQLSLEKEIIPQITTGDDEDNPDNSHPIQTSKLTHQVIRPALKVGRLCTGSGESRVQREPGGTRRSIKSCYLILLQSCHHLH